MPRHGWSHPHGPLVTTRPHNLTLKHALAWFHNRTKGLSEAEAATRLADIGLNSLPVSQPAGPAEVFLHQYPSPLIDILLAASTVSPALEQWDDAGFILGVLLRDRNSAMWVWKLTRSPKA